MSARKIAEEAVERNLIDCYGCRETVVEACEASANEMREACAALFDDGADEIAAASPESKIALHQVECLRAFAARIRAVEIGNVTPKIIEMRRRLATVAALCGRAARELAEGAAGDALETMRAADEELCTARVGARVEQTKLGMEVSNGG